MCRKRGRIGMELFKTKLIFTLLAFGLIAGGLLGILLYYQFPDYYPSWYIGILSFFLILEPLIMICVESSSRKSTSRQLLNVYMLTKVVKIFAALVFIGIYALVVKEGLKSFVLTFMLLYLLFLAIESYLFLKIEKRLKQKQQ